jgi:hypothetical protein
VVFLPNGWRWVFGETSFTTIPPPVVCLVSFAGVATAAENLEVVCCVGAAFVEWNDVVECEVVGTTAVGAVW